MIKKFQLESILIQIEGVQDSKPIGLLTEESGLGLKRKLRKIQKELIEYWEEYKKDIAEVEAIADEEKKKVEVERLLSESVELKSEKAMMSEIEKINSSFPYNFELLELIAQ